MQVIPVIDILGRKVVRGVAGKRDEYQPLVSKLVESPTTKPADIARAFAGELGLTSVYVADLDAILKGKPNLRAYEQVSKAGLRVMLDAGFADGEQGGALIERCASFAPDIVVGLETLASLAALRQLVHLVGREGCIFSLDLMQGKPLTRIEAWKTLPPLEIVQTVLGTGLRRLIILDLADVGVGSGTSTLDLCRRIGDAHPEVELIAGGGVRKFEDLEYLAHAGCSGALVASALHDGRLTRDDVERARDL